MNLTRLMVLGTLVRHGPRHGHEIRRIAEVTNVGEWGGVSVGALYRELRTMEGEGLVEAIRTEQVGRRPARTVYAITSEGQLELAMLRERAVRSVHWGQDPLGVALSFGTSDVDWEELTSWLRERREMFAISSSQLAAERERLVAKGHLGPVEAAVMYRGQLHAETEVRWHDEFAKILADLLAAGLAPQAPGHKHRGATGPGDGPPTGPAPARRPPPGQRAPAFGQRAPAFGQRAPAHRPARPHRPASPAS